MNEYLLQFRCLITPESFAAGHDIGTYNFLGLPSLFFQPALLILSFLHNLLSTVFPEKRAYYFLTISWPTYNVGESIFVKAAELNSMDGYDVDMFGNVLFGNAEGKTVYGSFSMDCYYQCALEVWGNKGKLFTNRIFTAPPGYVPTVKVETVQGIEEITLQEDDHFKKSIEQFEAAVKDDKVRKAMAMAILTNIDSPSRIVASLVTYPPASSKAPPPNSFLYLKSLFFLNGKPKLTLYERISGMGNIQ